jgi:calcineurin-like phosphoesterase family protein
MPNIFFTSDPHYNHANIIKYCNRPFNGVHEMNEELIKRYNEKVRPEDHVYILGDFGMYNHEKFARRLNGQKHLIFGNHDAKFRNKFLQWGFSWARDVHQLQVDKKLTIWLAHYAHRTWPKRHFGAWHLFGHSHGKIIGEGFSTDVGVDCWNYAPVSLEELRVFFKDRKPYPDNEPKEDDREEY